MKTLYATFPTMLLFACFLQAETSSIFIRKLEASNIWIRAEASPWGPGAICHWLNEINDIDKKGVGEDLESVIVTEYTKKPSPQKALFLGICGGKASLNLLIKTRNNVSPL